jgi:fatty-acid desaturase
MLKQSFKAKKVLTILLAVLFVASLTVGAASACHLHGHHHCVGSCSSYGSPHSHSCGCSHSHTGGCSHCRCNEETACENDD